MLKYWCLQQQQVCFLASTTRPQILPGCKKINKHLWKVSVKSVGYPVMFLFTSIKDLTFKKQNGDILQKTRSHSSTQAVSISDSFNWFQHVALFWNFRIRALLFVKTQENFTKVILFALFTFGSHLSFIFFSSSCLSGCGWAQVGLFPRSSVSSLYLSWPIQPPTSHSPSVLFSRPRLVLSFVPPASSQFCSRWRRLLREAAHTHTHTCPLGRTNKAGETAGRDGHGPLCVWVSLEGFCHLHSQSYAPALVFLGLLLLVLCFCVNPYGHMDLSFVLCVQTQINHMCVLFKSIILP